MIRYLLTNEGPTDFSVWKLYAGGVSVTSFEPFKKGEKLQPKACVASKFFGFFGPLTSRPVIRVITLKPKFGLNFIDTLKEI